MLHPTGLPLSDYFIKRADEPYCVEFCRISRCHLRIFEPHNLTMSPVLYVDYDGIFHASDVRVTPEEPLRPRVYERGEPTDQPLFRFMSLLELLLAPYPELKIVLATSWVRVFGYEFAVEQLSPGLRARVIGATTFPARTRFDSIAIDAEGRGLTRWLALDDDLCGWPEDRRYQVVAPTNPVLGLAQPGVAAELAAMLEALCSGQPLELVSKVAAVPSTVDRVMAAENRLRALPNITEAEICEALETDARVEEILRQARARPCRLPVSDESIEAGKRLTDEFRKASATAVLARIESGELIKSEELAARLGVSMLALGKAVTSGKMFVIHAPSGESYYPAFFADDQYAKGWLSEVSQALGRLPGPSKYHFLTSKSTRLGQPPLDALAGGRLAEVLVSAKGFRER